MLRNVEKCGVHAAFKVTKAERGHLLSGGREAWLASTNVIEA
jgi:hypothetical protein